MANELTVWSALRYLTEIGGPAWRDQDFTARDIIKIVKGELFNGYCEITIGGKKKRFNQNNGQTLLPYLYAGLAKKAASLAEGKFCLVPIPNSEAVIGDDAAFRTLDHAAAIARCVGGQRAVAVGALRWKQAKKKGA